MTASWIVKLAAAMATIPAVMAHMEMTYPPPLRSTHNQFTLEGQKDYTNTAPLDPSGSNYPCKGYHTNTDLKSVATYTPGQSCTVKIGGGAPHRGGSCQISLSYDNGKSFHVVHSVIGGCPMGPTDINFTLPKDIPSGPALFAWTWFNNAGNREMYMNCAAVTIGGGNSRVKGYGKAMNTPQIFIANLSGIGNCAVTEGTDVIFPEPGPSVQYGGSCKQGDKPQAYLNGCTYPGMGGSSGYTGGGSGNQGSGNQGSGNQGSGNQGSGNQGSGNQSGGNQGSGSGYQNGGNQGSGSGYQNGGNQGSGNQSGNQQPGNGQAPYKPGPPAGNKPPVVSNPNSGNGSKNGGNYKGDGQNSGPVSGGPQNGNGYKAPSQDGAACSNNGQIICGADGLTWSVCDQGKVKCMGKTAGGMQCVNGAMVRANAAPSYNSSKPVYNKVKRSHIRRAHVRRGSWRL